MNPAFSIAHMKRLIPLFTAVSKQARKVMADDIKRAGRSETDVLDYMSKLALVRERPLTGSLPLCSCHSFRNSSRREASGTRLDHWTERKTSWVAH